MTTRSVAGHRRLSLSETNLLMIAARVSASLRRIADGTRLDRQDRQDRRDLNAGINLLQEALRIANFDASDPRRIRARELGFGPLAFGYACSATDDTKEGAKRLLGQQFEALLELKRTGTITAQTSEAILQFWVGLYGRLQSGRGRGR